jgi:tetratricopeptide (TPR) repeat protein
MLHDIGLSTGLLTPWTTLPALALTLAIPAGAWFFRNSCPLASFSLLFFWVNHLIEGTVIPLEIVFEHRNYLPSMFVFLLPALGFLWLAEKHPLRYPPLLLSVLMLIVFLLSQGHTTFMRNELLSNPVLAWLDNVNKAPALHRPHHNLGGAYLIYGLEEKGIAELQTALNSRAAARYDQKYETHYNLGIYYLSKNEPAAAVGHMQAALGYAPKNGKLLLGMARALFFLDDLKQAETYATYALSAASLRPAALMLLGWIHLRQGDPIEARKMAVAALKSSPKSREPFFLIGESFRLQNDPAKALHHYSLYRRDNSCNLFVLAALIEAQDMLGKTGDRKKTVWQLLENAGGRLAEVLATYDQRYNRIGEDRMQRIQGAIEETVGQALLHSDSTADKFRRGPVTKENAPAD